MARGALDGWREPGGLPDGAPVVHSDAELRSLVEHARRTGEALPLVGLAGGDLCRTLGGRGEERRLRSDDGARCRVDVGRANLDGAEHWFVAHLVARRRWWRGRLFVAMNAEWCGDLCLGPRAHPGDGLLDVTRGSLRPADRLRARSRARSGSHLPHPDLGVQRCAATEMHFDRPTGVWLDGEAVGPVRDLAVQVEEGSLWVVV
jgi:hypothetical protein